MDESGGQINYRTMIKVFSILLPENISDVFLNRMYRLLGEEELKRIQAKKFRVDRIRSLLGRMLLIRYLNKEIFTVQLPLTLLYSNYNKPILAGSSRDFSISHSGNWVVLAVSECGLIGIDIEEHIQMDFLSLSQLCYSLDEIRYLKSIPSKEGQKKAFFNVWTMKEAYLKAIGKGLTSEITQISCVDEKDGLYFPKKVYQSWGWQEIEIATEYSLNLCSDIHNFQTRDFSLEKITLDDLFSTIPYA